MLTFLHRIPRLKFREEISFPIITDIAGSRCHSEGLYRMNNCARLCADLKIFRIAHNEKKDTTRFRVDSKPILGRQVDAQESIND
jgi:hypothetical protein